jgi:tetratricopeptide (TPR) repeat protein
MGLIYFERDQFKDSVAPFQQAIALRPQASLYFKLGEAYIRIGDKSSALEQYRALKGINSIMAQQLLDQINEKP